VLTEREIKKCANANIVGYVNHLRCYFQLLLDRKEPLTKEEVYQIINCSIAGEVNGSKYNDVE